MPDVYYARVSNFLSDPRDRFIAVGDSEDDVYHKIRDYLLSSEGQERYHIDDPTELENNIRTCIFKKGTKAIHNRPPDAEPVK